MNIWTYLVVIAFVGVAWAGFSRPFYGPGSCGGTPLFNVTFEPNECYAIPWPGQCSNATFCASHAPLETANLATLLSDCEFKNGSVRFDSGGNHMVFFANNCTGPISSLTCIEFSLCGAERGEMMDWGLLTTGSSQSQSSLAAASSWLFE